MTTAKMFLSALVAAVALQPYAQSAESAAIAPAAATQPAAATAPAPVDEEEQVDDGLKRFGYLAGVARGCVVETQRVDLEREALDLHAAIARLLGTDRAFLFATSFGYGTTIVVETRDCAEVLKNYEARVEKFRASRGAQQ